MKKLLLIMIFTLVGFTMNAQGTEGGVDQFCWDYGLAAVEAEEAAYGHMDPWTYFQVAEEWRAFCEESEFRDSLIVPIFI